MNHEETISVSLIDYIGKIENGVGVIISIMINNIPYEMVYWFNRDGKRSIKIEEKFYHHFPQIRDIYEYEYLIDLLYYIDETLLPSREDIFNEFLN